MQCRAIPIALLAAPLRHKRGRPGSESAAVRRPAIPKEHHRTLGSRRPTEYPVFLHLRSYPYLLPRSRIPSVCLRAPAERFLSPVRAPAAPAAKPFPASATSSLPLPPPWHCAACLGTTHHRDLAPQ